MRMWTCFSFSRTALWVGTTSFMILVLPVVFETERLQLEQQQLQQQRQVGVLEQRRAGMDHQHGRTYKHVTHLFLSPICYRSCWGPTLECLVGCKAWCLLRLAKCDQGAAWIQELQLAIPSYRSRGETERPQRRAEDWHQNERLMSAVASGWLHILDHLTGVKEENDVLVIKTFLLPLLTPTSRRDFFSWSIAPPFFFFFFF